MGGNSNGHVPVGGSDAAIAAAARFRQRKVSLKQNLRILWQKDVPDIEEDAGREVVGVETGVEKHEEEEHHLQAVLNAFTADKKAQAVYIPTPKAATGWPEYKKFYKPDWSQPATYIRQSATVEDAAGCPYNMDEEDLVFCERLNEEATDNRLKCSEDEFEMIVYLFESTVKVQQPFLATDPTQLMEFKTLEQHILSNIEAEEKDPNSLNRLLAQTKSSVYTQKYTPSPYRTVAASFKTFGAKIYAHWKSRKIARKGKEVTPSLKFESGSQDDENDPYVCFRHREVRQTRKTRRTDQQSSERLRKLQAEMQQAKRLFEMVARREQLRLQNIQFDWDIFEQRCKVKALKRKLNISGDDEDLITVKKKREERRPVPTAAAAAPAATAAPVKKEEKAVRPSAPAVAAAAGREPAAAYVKASSSNKIPDLEMHTLEQALQEKEAVLRADVKNHLRERAQQDLGWVNYTDSPYVPYSDYFDPKRTRFERDQTRHLDRHQSIYSSLESPYPCSTSSRLQLPLSSSLGKQYVARRAESPPQVIWTRLNKQGEMTALRQLSDNEIPLAGGVSIPRYSAVQYRKRLDRGGVVFLDRRGLTKKPEQLENPSNAEEERLVDRFLFDDDSTVETIDDWCGEPARLNGLSESTQSIRFGSMLLGKSYDQFHEVQLQHQQHILHMQQKLAARKEAVAAAQAAVNQKNGNQRANSGAAGGSRANSTSQPANALATASTNAPRSATPNGTRSADGKKGVRLPGWSSSTTFTGQLNGRTNSGDDSDGKNSIGSLGMSSRSPPKVETSV